MNPTPEKPATVAAAAAQARRWPHGSRLHSDAMSVLFAAYGAAHPAADGTFVTLDALWAWVDAELNDDSGERRQPFETHADVARREADVKAAADVARREERSSNNW